jgi:hypothetical protein
MKTLKERRRICILAMLRNKCKIVGRFLTLAGGGRGIVRHAPQPTRCRDRFAPSTTLRMVSALGLQGIFNITD